MPKSERTYKARNQIVVLDEKGIAAMRKVAKIGREVLDIAAAAAVPGVTTDYIDEIVHKACMERDVRFPACSRSSCLPSRRHTHHRSTITTFQNLTALQSMKSSVMVFRIREYSSTETFSTLIFPSIMEAIIAISMRPTILVRKRNKIRTQFELLRRAESP